MTLSPNYTGNITEASLQFIKVQSSVLFYHTYFGGSGVEIQVETLTFCKILITGTLCTDYIRKNTGEAGPRVFNPLTCTDKVLDTEYSKECILSFVTGHMSAIL